MRLRRLEIREFRGIRCTDLEFTPEGILIYGPNAVGKSSIVQAIEYLLTDSVNRLTGEGTGHKSLQKYLHHKESNPEQSKITAVFSDGESEVGLQRCVADGELHCVADGDIERFCDAEDEGDELPHSIRRLQVAMDRHQNILWRDELLQFIDSPDHKRSEALNTILRLDQIDSYRTNLQTAKNDFNSARKDAKNELRDAQNTFYDELEDGLTLIKSEDIDSIASDETAITVVNRLRDQYDVEPISDISVSDFTFGITEPKEPVEHPLARSTTASQLNNIIENSENLPSILDSYVELTDAITSLKSDPKLERDIRAQQLIKQGQKLLEKDASKCPLCLTAWTDNDLGDLLEKRRKKATDAEHRREHIENRIKSIDKSFQEIENDLEQLISDLDAEIPDGYDDLSVEKEILNEFKLNLSSIRSEMKEGDLLEIPFIEEDSDTLELELVPTELGDTLQNLVDIEEDVDKPENRLAAYRTLVLAEQRYKSYLEKEVAFEVANQFHKVSEELYEDFQTVRKRILDDTLEGILTEFCSTIKLFSDNILANQDIEEYAFKSTKAGIRFLSKFHDGRSYRPNILYSEGQQDIMGLVLFLSMSRVVTIDEVQIIVLDDVLSSVDAEHRANVARILDSEYGEEFQFIITTHDLVWSRHLRRTKHIDDENVVHLSGWSYSGGVHRHIDITKPRDNIEYHLNNNDLTAAAAWTRKMAEFYAAKGCEEFGVKVQLNKIEQLSLKDYIEGLLPELTDRLDHYSTDDDTIFGDDEVEELLSTIGDFQGFIYRNHWGLNKNVHYSEPEVGSYSETELETNLESFDRLFDFLYCQVCDCWRSETDRGIECECSLLVKT